MGSDTRRVGFAFDVTREVESGDFSVARLLRRDKKKGGFSARHYQRTESEAAGGGVDYLRPIARFPELAGDLANVAFTKAGGRKHSKH